MIRILTLTVFLLASVMITQIDAQDMPKKYALIELFTNAPCPSCASQNPGLFERLEDYEGDLHQISFYPGRPYSHCPIYQMNRSDNEARTAYRGITGTPQNAINGERILRSSQVSTSVLDGLIGDESELHVGVTESGTNDRLIEVALTNVGSETLEGRLFVVYAQEYVSLAGVPNIVEEDHYNVFQDFLTAVDGEPISIGADASANVSYTVMSTTNWEDEGYYALAWVEDADGVVVNSGTRFDEAFSSTDDGIAPEAALQIHPVPAQDFLNVETSTPWHRAEAISADGKVNQVWTGQRDQLDISTLGAGTYILRLYTDQGAQQRRFIKLAQ